MARMEMTWDEVKRRMKNGATVKTIAELNGVAEQTVYNFIKKNREVLNRMKIVEEHIPSGQDKSVSARIFYLNRLALQHELRKSINASMDPEIVKDMLATKVYKKTEIKDVVQELSPFLHVLTIYI